jgi:hypothetical protein
MSNQKLFNPHRGINLQNLSDASVCYPGNQISTCVNFTPNTNIKTMSSNVYHGEVGGGSAVSIVSAVGGRVDAEIATYPEKFGTCRHSDGSWNSSATWPFCPSN